MPTPSDESSSVATPTAVREWTARPAGRPRSLFGNYAPSEEPQPSGGPASENLPAAIAAPALQEAIDLALARSALYRWLALAYEDPTADSPDRLLAGLLSIEPALQVLSTSAPGLSEAVATLRARLQAESFETFLHTYLAAFGHAARGQCPLNEIEYGELKADQLFQPHRLADVAAFYRAFGLEVAADADERQDHLCLELEFMCVLAAKEAFALEHQLDSDDLALGRDAQKKFLREHLGRWTPAFARRLARFAGDSVLGALAMVTRLFIDAECGRCGITPGNEDLMLRPVDEAGESLCTGCGADRQPPGAVPPA